METSIVKGTIKKLVLDRGFGFISPNNGGDDIFFHCSALSQKSDFDSLQEGQAVTYVEAAGKDDRPKADDVQLV